MTEIPEFGGWTPEAHAGPKQENARKAAAKEETTPRSVDRERQTAVFWGSGKDPYQTTLSSCTCGAFRAVRGKAPCKHIYRLAMELGILRADYVVGMDKHERIQTQMEACDAVAELEKLSPAAKQTACSMLAHLRADRHAARLVESPEVIAELRACPLMEERPAADEILSHMKRGALYALAAKSGGADPPGKNASTAALVSWLKENVGDLDRLLPAYAAFAFIPEFDRAQPAVMSYYSMTQAMCAEKSP